MNKTFKSFKELDQKASMTSDSKRDALLDFIIRYQRSNEGDGPSIQAMMAEMAVPETAIRILLGKLEANGSIHFISKNPMRIMVRAKGQPLPHEMPDAPPQSDPDRYSRFLDAEATRHQIGRFIGSFEDSKGRAPTLREVMDAIGTTNGAWTNRAIEILAERGFVAKGGLTGKARLFYRMKPKTIVVVEAEEAAMNNTTKSTVVVRQRRPRTVLSAWQRGEMVGKMVADYTIEHGEPPLFGEVMDALGWPTQNPVTRAIENLVQRGLMKPRTKASHRSLFLTDAGWEHFGHKPVDGQPEPEQPDNPTPEPEPERVSYREPERRTMPEPPATRLALVDTAELVLELIDRGYTVRRN